MLLESLVLLPRGTFEIDNALEGDLLLEDMYVARLYFDVLAGEGGEEED